MVTVSIGTQAQIGVEEILTGVSCLDTPDLERFHLRIGQMLAGRNGHDMAKAEQKLLEKIREPLLPEAQQREYDLLRAKQRNETISPVEYRTYMKLMRQTERRGVERLRCLVELAQLRRVGLPELMARLQLTSLHPANA